LGGIAVETTSAIPPKMMESNKQIARFGQGLPQAHAGERTPGEGGYSPRNDVNKFTLSRVRDVGNIFNHTGLADSHILPPVIGHGIIRNGTLSELEAKTHMHW
jgi:hypothetical protein